MGIAPVIARRDQPCSEQCRHGKSDGENTLHFAAQHWIGRNVPKVPTRTPEYTYRLILAKSAQERRPGSPALRDSSVAEEDRADGDDRAMRSARWTSRHLPPMSFHPPFISFHRTAITLSHVSFWLPSAC